MTRTNATNANVQCEVDEVVLANNEHNKVPNGPDGGDEAIFYGVDDQPVEETLGLDEDRILSIVA